MTRPTFTLTDDGTLDTVVRCAGCGEERRYNYAADGNIATDPDTDETYEEFVEWAIEDATCDHECLTKETL